MLRKPLQPPPIDGETFMRALDGLAMGLILMNGQGHVLWLNRAARRVLAIDEDAECAGVPLSGLLKDPQLAAFWRDAGGSDHAQMGDISLQYPHACELKINATDCHDQAGDRIARALLFCDVTAERRVQMSVSRAVADRLIELVGAPDAEPAPSASAQNLTPQEHRVLRLLSDGRSNAEIAEAVGVSLSTIRTHLKHLYRKMGLKSRTEAVSRAVRSGLV